MTTTPVQESAVINNIICRQRIMPSRVWRRRQQGSLINIVSWHAEGESCCQLAICVSGKHNGERHFACFLLHRSSCRIFT